LSLANGRSLQRNYHQRGVDFDLTPEQELIRDTVRTFARERVEPLAAELDLTGRFPYELVTELGGGEILHLGHYFLVVRSP